MGLSRHHDETVACRCHCNGGRTPSHRLSGPDRKVHESRLISCRTCDSSSSVCATGLICRWIARELSFDELRRKRAPRYRRTRPDERAPSARRGDCPGVSSLVFRQPGRQRPHSSSGGLSGCPDAVVGGEARLILNVDLLHRVSICAATHDVTENCSHGVAAIAAPIAKEHHGQMCHHASLRLRCRRVGARFKVASYGPVDSTGGLLQVIGAEGRAGRKVPFWNIWLAVQPAGRVPRYAIRLESAGG